MKTVTEMHDAKQGWPGRLAASARKAAYAVLGLPLVTRRRLAEVRGEVLGGARKGFDLLASEGEKLADELRERKIVSEIREKVDLDHLHDRVEKLRDQLEDALTSWRESFRPHEGEQGTSAPAGPEGTSAQEPNPEPN